jgi:hypothetical protein
MDNRKEQLRQGCLGFLVGGVLGMVIGGLLGLGLEVMRDTLGLAIPAPYSDSDSWLLAGLLAGGNAGALSGGNAVRQLAAESVSEPPALFWIALWGLIHGTIYGVLPGLGPTLILKRMSIALGFAFVGAITGMVVSLLVALGWKPRTLNRPPQ